MVNKDKKLSSERVQRVIELCKSVDEQGVDPFAVDVDDIISTLRQYFPDWESPEELTMDAEAVQCLASVIQNQGNWVKHRSTSLYTDPFLLEEKIQKLDKQELATVFTSVWNPIIEMEQLSIPSLAQALKYWNDLAPVDERWQRDDPLQVEAGATTREELVMLKILAEKTFMEELETFWSELKQTVGTDKILYWDFVGADTYQETLDRAYMTSFLVTYGYATLELVPLEEEIFIKALDEPRELGDKRMVSVPISVSFEEWTRWKKEKTL
ncbi:MAG: hypothetical protein CW691_00300 [Candidatus Bathyarchaeum sp.]|nr:MAG: hypothetical protein CW691_00300 [Candidatus Bathyarchaeum sp.]